MDFGLNSKTAFHTSVASIYSCSVTADDIGKESRKIAAYMSFIIYDSCHKPKLTKGPSNDVISDMSLYESKNAAYLNGAELFY